MANEKRLIDANEAEKEVQTIIDKILRWRENKDNIKDVAIRADEVYKLDNWLGCYADSLDIIQNAPTVDAVEVVHGKWLFDSGSERHFCSACNEYALSATTQEQVADYDWEENLVFHLEPVTKEFWTDYCPNCGAKMDGDGNG